MFKYENTYLFQFDYCLFDNCYFQTVECLRTLKLVLLKFRFSLDRFIFLMFMSLQQTKS